MLGKALYSAGLVVVADRRRHTSCALVTGVQACALPIPLGLEERVELLGEGRALHPAIGRLGIVFGLLEFVHLGDVGIVIAAERRAIGLGAFVGARHQHDSAGQLAAPLIEILARSEEHTSELQSLMRISYAVFCLKKKK